MKMKTTTATTTALLICDLVFFGSVVTALTELEASFPQLGTNSFAELSFDFELTVDDNCDYTLTVEYVHNENFPVGDGDTCVAGSTADEYDGRLFLEGRWYYELFPAYVEEATEINHLSLDWNPCGHPTGGFLIPHYDLHFNRVTPEFRATQLFCEHPAGIPACFPVQTSDIGQGFFKVARDLNTNLLMNMPETFEFNPADAVLYMGSHSFDRGGAPSDPTDWNDPTYVLVTYNEDIIAVEPMLPFHFAIGDVDHSYESDITYVNQTIESLPFHYGATFNGDSKAITVTLKGKSKVCQADFEEQKTAFVQSQSDSGGAYVSRLGDIMVGLMLAATTSLVVATAVW